MKILARATQKNGRSDELWFDDWGWTHRIVRADGSADNVPVSARDAVQIGIEILGRWNLSDELSFATLLDPDEQGLVVWLAGEPVRFLPRGWRLLGVGESDQDGWNCVEFLFSRGAEYALVTYPLITAGIHAGSYAGINAGGDEPVLQLPSKAESHDWCLVHGVKPPLEMDAIRGISSLPNSEQVQTERGEEIAEQPARSHRRSTIPPDKRTKPMSKTEAMNYIGWPKHIQSQRQAVDWLSNCIRDGVYQCEPINSMRFVFNVDDFPAEARREISKT